MKIKKKRNKLAVIFIIELRESFTKEEIIAKVQESKQHLVEAKKGGVDVLKQTKDWGNVLSYKISPCDFNQPTNPGIYKACSFNI